MRGIMPRVLTWFGRLLVIVSLGFIAYIFWEQRQKIGSLEFDTALILVLASTAFTYGCAGFLLSGAWYVLLNAISDRPVSAAWCHAVYGRTQIGKYIPGNIFHFAGRQVLAKQSGLSQLLVLASTVYEMLLLLAASSSLAFTGLLLMRVQVQGASLSFVGTVLVLIVGSITIAFSLAPFIARRRGVNLPLQGLSHHVRVMWPCYVLYLVFFLITGTMLAILVTALTGLPFTTGMLATVIIIFSCSWIAGYVTPGAPGGVGVREAIIIFSLAGMIGEAPATVAALLFRCITVGGDVVFYLLSLPFSLSDQTTRDDDGPERRH
jgi:glycosyltransferase 2 family protein